MNRRFFLGMLLLFSLLLAACGDLTEKLHGAWKTEAADASGTKTTVLVLTANTLSVNGNTQDIIFKTISLSVDVADKNSQSSLFLATNIEKDSFMAQGGRFTEKTKLVRISEAEALQLNAAP